MSSTAIVVIVVVVIVAAALVAGLMMAQRRRRLQQRFGPEYDRLVDEHDSKRKAEAELTQREKRVRELDIRPLTDSARARYATQWAALQEQFVDTPADAVSASQVLVSTVMRERGYPTDDSEQVLADLSVEHASTLEHYRSAEQINLAAAAGSASTEDLRQAMIHYRALFRELLGETADAHDGSASPVPAQERLADEQLAEPEYSVPAEPAGGSAVPATDEPAETAEDDVPVQEPAYDADVPAVTGDEPADVPDSRIPLQRTPRS